MPDWKRIIVGDAFKLPSHDFNYYRDLLLSWPILLFTVTGLASLFGIGHDYRVGLKYLAVSLVAILLTRERLIYIAGGLGFCAVQGLLSFGFRHDWRGLAAAICFSACCLLLLRYLKDYKPSYEWPKGHGIVDILISALSFGFCFLLFRWIGR